MKKFIFFFFALFSLFTFSQQTDFNYQAIIKGSNGMAVSGQSVVMQFSIIYDAANGTLAYQETHTVSTSVNGLVNLVIGSGAPTSQTGDSWGAIDWGKPLFLKEEVNLGSGFATLGTGRIYAVPVANYAAKAGAIKGVMTGLVSSTHVTATTFSGNGSGLINITAGAITGIITAPISTTHVTATTFSGNGSGLSNITAGAITGLITAPISTTHVTATAFSGDGSGLTNLSSSIPLTSYGTPYFDSSFTPFATAVASSVVTVGNMQFRYSQNSVDGHLEGKTISGSLDAQRYTRIITPNNASGATAGISMHTNSRGFNDNSWDNVLFFWTGSDYSGVGSLSHYKTEEHELIIRSNSSGGSIRESYKIFITIEGGSRVFIRAQYFN
tara:strand:+ start:224 stop:1375 length:1152 start_codon:yes stop_codon:yes gene_type:complete